MCLLNFYPRESNHHPPERTVSDGEDVRMRPSHTPAFRKMRTTSTPLRAQVHVLTNIFSRTRTNAQTHKRTQKCTEILFYLMKTIKNNRGKHALDLSPFRPGTATFLNAGLKPTSNFFLALCGLIGWRILGFDTLARCVSNTAGPRVWWKMSRMRVTENAGALRAGWVCQLEKKLYTMHVNDE